MKTLKERNVLEVTDTLKWIVGFIGVLITFVIALCVYLYNLHSDDIQTNTQDIKKLLEFSLSNYQTFDKRLTILENSQKLYTKSLTF